VGGGDTPGVEEWCDQHETGVVVSSVRHGNARPASWTTAIASHHTDGIVHDLP
jgi:hypothetical protein